MAETDFQVPLLIESHHLLDSDSNSSSSQSFMNTSESLLEQAKPILQKALLREEEDPEDEKEIDRMEFYVFLLICMTFFFVVAGAIEKYKPRCGH